MNARKHSSEALYPTKNAQINCTTGKVRQSQMRNLHTTTPAAPSSYGIVSSISTAQGSTGKVPLA